MCCDVELSVSGAYTYLVDCKIVYTSLKLFCYNGLVISFIVSSYVYYLLLKYFNKQ